MSRIQPSSPSGSPMSSASAHRDSPASDQRGCTSEHPSSSVTQPRMSEGSESYPSWLPKRPPPPDPGSTLHSFSGMHDAGLVPTEAFPGGRKPTPRSVRVVSLQDAAQPVRDRREPTDQIRVPHPLQPRVWSRATTAGLSPTLVSAAVDSQGHMSRPRFRSVGLHPELLRNPSPLARVYFYLLPLIVFYHVPLQTFFDFNAVFMLLQIAKYPNPVAPGVPGSGKNWALGAAAYIACWLVWITIVFMLYELVYSFYRRWRVKRPLIAPLYLASSGFNLVCMTSYTNFCFMQYIRFSAFFGENGSLRDGLAETFWFYSQNLPTVALLLPRAGLALALLLAFSDPNPDYVSMVEAGFSGRDGTFFRASDGTLTDYARGVLIANAAWTAWRILVLVVSWIGLWILSGQGCAGICGPRYRWEEEEHEKTMSIYSDGVSEADSLPWVWRLCTRLRIQEAYDFCLTVKPSARWTALKKEGAGEPEMLGVSTTPAFDVDQVLAAVGLPSVPTPARRAPLSGDLFEPKSGAAGAVHTPPAELSDIIPKVVKRSSKEREMAGPSAPLMKLPYPFTGYGARASSKASSKDQIPFPPSPGSRKEKRRSPAASSAARQSSTSERVAKDEDDEVEDTQAEEEEVEDEDEDDGEEEEEAEAEKEGDSEACPRTSGSMSSLGQPIMSRYPFQFRRPHGRGGSSGAVVRSTPQSDDSPSSNSRSGHSQSTGNRETSSESQMSPALSSSVMSSPGSGYGSGSPIPMPPRHPQPGRGRARAGTVPTSFPTSPSPVMFPGRIPSRLRTDSQGTEGLGSGYDSFMSEPHDELDDGEEEEVEPQMMEQPEPEGPHEAAEGEDSVGLLGVMPRSPRSSNVSSRRRRGRRDSSRSDSQSRSASSRSSVVRSRAQSLIQSLSAASRSSIDVVQSIRSRTNSMARLEEDPGHTSDSRSHSGSASEGVQSANENYTFGQPIRVPMGRRTSSTRLRPAASSPSISTPSIATTAFTARPESRECDTERRGVPIPLGSDESRPDISTAAQSFITAPATLAGTSDTTERAPSWAEHMVDRPLSDQPGSGFIGPH
ncbi:hypothetical protein ID866_7976 [Astraeus odoratus]|nr:hypothetical protein ID866_7976 [Astraeus odoratus]